MLDLWKELLNCVETAHASPLSINCYWIAANPDTVMNTVIKLWEPLLVGLQSLNVQNCACVCRRYHTGISYEIAVP